MLMLLVLVLLMMLLMVVSGRHRGRVLALASPVKQCKEAFLVSNSTWASSHVNLMDRERQKVRFANDSF